MSATTLKHENDFITAIQRIAEADDGSGSIVDRNGDSLTDAANSLTQLVHDDNELVIAEWEELEGRKIPTVAVNITDIVEMAGTADRWEIDTQFDAWAPKGSTSSALANRLEDVLNSSNFLSEGLDVSHVVTRRGRNPLTDGGRRTTVEMTFRLTR